MTRKALPAGWLGHRDFILRVGELLDREWTGTEHTALPPNARDAEFDRIGDDEAAEAYCRQIRRSIEDVLASVEPAAPGESCGPCRSRKIEVAAVERIGGVNYCAMHGEEQRRALSEEITSISGLTNGAVIAAGREKLEVEIEAQWEPEQLARARWNRVYEAVRHKVLAGEISPGAIYAGELRVASLEDLRQRYPGPHEEVIELASLPLPSRIAFRDADIEIFKASGQEDRKTSRPRSPQPFWTNGDAEIDRWLEDEGCPERGDGRQALLEAHITTWLAKRGHTPASSTIGLHVRKRIEYRRNHLGIEDR